MGHRWHFLIAAFGLPLASQTFDKLVLNQDHPAIQWRNDAGNDDIAKLAGRLRSGEVALTQEGETGYLRSLLKALNIPVSSQMLVFSRTSLQRHLITPGNPRALYFNDTTSIGYINGAPLIEIATLDPRQGVNFYVLDQSNPTPRPVRKTTECTNCHETQFGPPGMILQSLPTASDGQPLYQLGYWPATDKTPFENRWGGWFVTGKHTPFPHMGNHQIANPRQPGEIRAATPSSEKLDSISRYLTPTSDIIALMVFEHQMETTNWITRLGWHARILKHDNKPAAELAPTIETVVDALLFTGEAAPPTRLAGTSSFLADFLRQAKRDKRGRSLRDFDLEHRLFRYPLSYLIYSEAFDALPEEAKASTYSRLWRILSGELKDKRYEHLTPETRQAIVEILRDTKADLPEAFRSQPVQ